jgi:hypothetical protein
MTTDELVVAIEEFMTTYDPYGFYDVYNSWKPNDASYKDIKQKVENKDAHMIEWFADVANNSDDQSERDNAEVIYNALVGADVEANTKVSASTWKPYAGAYECPNCGYISDEKTDFCRRCEADLRACSVVGDTDIFGEDPEFFFTRDDIIDYIETPLEEQLPEIKSCRGYIDKEDDKYILSVDIITDDYELTGVAAPSVTIDMRKIRKPADLGKYLTPIIQIYTDTIIDYGELADTALDPYFDDPTQHGNLDEPITPWGGSVD